MEHSTAYSTQMDHVEMQNCDAYEVEKKSESNVAYITSLAKSSKWQWSTECSYEESLSFIKACVVTEQCHDI